MLEAGRGVKNGFAVDEFGFLVWAKVLKELGRWRADFAARWVWSWSKISGSFGDWRRGSARGVLERILLFVQGLQAREKKSAWGFAHALWSEERIYWIRNP